MCGLNNEKQARWDAAWAVVKTKNFTHADETELKEARKAYETGNKKDPTDTSLRLFTKRYITNNVHVTPAQKAAMRLTVPDEAGPAAADILSRSSAPQLGIKAMSYLVHQLQIVYVGIKSRAKPKGIKDTLVYMCLQDAALTTNPDISSYQYIGDISRGTFISRFTDAQEGMRAFYFVREKTTKGKLGSPSRVIKMIVP